MAGSQEKATDSDAKAPDTRLQITMPGIVAEKCGGLPSGYAYLIRSSLRMPELYPFLGEILFGGMNKRMEKEGKLTNNDTGTNLIVLSIDDDRETLLGAISDPEDRDKDGTYVNSFVTKGIQESQNAKYRVPRFAAWMDTFGSFEKLSPDLNKERFLGSESCDKNILEDIQWWRQQIVGAGNPMSMFRFFRVAGNKESPSADRLNLYLLSSLSNLYRNIGLSETAALLKVMLETVWRSAAGKSNLVCEREGLFFAVLQEGVMGDSEVSYLESFFDGVFRLDPVKVGNLRIPRLQVESLPLHFKLPESVLYLPQWQHNEARTNKELAWLGTLSASEGAGCFVQTYAYREDAQKSYREEPRR